MTSSLVHALAYELAAETSGLSGDELARRVRRRRADVLAALASDPCFVRRGVTRGTRYRLVAAYSPRRVGTNTSDFHEACDSQPASTRESRRTA